MKKRLFALASALILTFGMSVSVFAADSASTGTTTTTVVAVSVDQELNDTDLATIAAGTGVSTTVQGVTKTAVSTDTAKSAATAAKSIVGSNSAIATVVDLHVPEGTGEADFTFTGLNVKAGQDIAVLHQKADGTWESLTIKSVVDGAVTFTMTSYSPVAVIIKNAGETTTVAANQADSLGPATEAALAYLASAGTTGSTGTAPKTGDVMVFMAIMASICLAGSVVFTKKAVR